MSNLKAVKPKEVEPGHCKILLFGKSGAGKTWLALDFPAPYYISPEEGASKKHYQAKLEKSGGVYLGPEEGACDFDTIIDQMKALATEKHPYKTLIIDSISKVYQVAIANEAERLGSKDAFGASKKPAIAQMRRLINWCGKLDLNVVFVSHEASEWGGTGNDRKEIGKMPDVWDKLVYELDLVLRIEHPSRGSRTAYVTKSRLVGFPEHDKFDLQVGEKNTGFEEFSKRYGQDYINGAVTPVTLCSAEQVAEIERLVSVLKIEEGEMDKLLTKANAETYAEFTDDQATKTIEWLEKKLAKPTKEET